MISATAGPSAWTSVWSTAARSGAPRREARVIASIAGTSGGISSESKSSCSVQPRSTRSLETRYEAPRLDGCGPLSNA